MAALRVSRGLRPVLRAGRHHRPDDRGRHPRTLQAGRARRPVAQAPERRRDDDARRVAAGWLVTAGLGLGPGLGLRHRAPVARPACRSGDRR